MIPGANIGQWLADIHVPPLEFGRFIVNFDLTFDKGFHFQSMEASADAKIISIVFDEAASKKQTCNAQFFTPESTKVPSLNVSPSHSTSSVSSALPLALLLKYWAATDHFWELPNFHFI